MANRPSSLAIAGWLLCGTAAGSGLPQGAPESGRTVRIVTAQVALTRRVAERLEDRNGRTDEQELHDRRAARALLEATSHEVERRLANVETADFALVSLLHDGVYLPLVDNLHELERLESSAAAEFERSLEQQLEGAEFERVRRDRTSRLERSYADECAKVYASFCELATRLGRVKAVKEEWWLARLEAEKLAGRDIGELAESVATCAPYLGATGLDELAYIVDTIIRQSSETLLKDVDASCDLLDQLLSHQDFSARAKPRASRALLVGHLRKALGAAIRPPNAAALHTAYRLAGIYQAHSIFERGELGELFTESGAFELRVEVEPLPAKTASEIERLRDGGFLERGNDRSFADVLERDGAVRVFLDETKLPAIGVPAAHYLVAGLEYRIELTDRDGRALSVPLTQIPERTGRYSVAIPETMPEDWLLLPPAGLVASRPWSERRFLYELFRRWKELAVLGDKSLDAAFRSRLGLDEARWTEFEERWLDDDKTPSKFLAEYAPERPQEAALSAEMLSTLQDTSRTERVFHFLPPELVPVWLELVGRTRDPTRGILTEDLAAGDARPERDREYVVVDVIGWKD